VCNEKKETGIRLVETVTKLVKESQKQLVGRDEVSNVIQWLIYSEMIGKCNLCNNGDVNNISAARRLYNKDCGIAAYLTSQSMLNKAAIEGTTREEVKLLKVFLNKHFVDKGIMIRRTVGGQGKTFYTIPVLRQVYDFHIYEKE